MCAEEIRRGEILAGLPADGWNEFCRTSRDVAQLVKGETGPGQSSGAVALEPEVFNKTGSDITVDRPVLAITKPLITTEDNELAIHDAVMFEGETPDEATTSAEIAILQGPVANDRSTAAVLVGPAWVEVEWTDAAHTAAAPKPGDNTKLQSAASGIRVIWHETIPGGLPATIWCQVMLGGGGGGSSPGGGGVAVLLERDIPGCTHNLEQFEGVFTDILGGHEAIITLTVSDHGLEVGDLISIEWEHGGQTFTRTACPIVLVIDDEIKISGGFNYAIDDHATEGVTEVVLLTPWRVPVGDPFLSYTPTKVALKKFSLQNGKPTLSRGADQMGDLVESDEDEEGTIYGPAGHDILDGETVDLWWASGANTRRSLVAIIAAASGTLSTRTSNTAGTATVEGEHEITTGMISDITWSGGERTGVTIGTVSGQDIPFSGGSGDNLPAEDDPITVDPSRYIGVSGEDEDGDDLPATSTEITITHYAAVLVEYRRLSERTVLEGRYEIAQCFKDSDQKNVLSDTDCMALPKFHLPALEPEE